MKSLSRELATFIYGLTFRQLPSEVVDRAKILILDAIGTAIAGRDLPYPRISLDLVKDDRGNATVFTHSSRLSPINAAFVNGNMIQALGQDDNLFAGHPGATTLPAVFAAAEEEGRSGAEAIVASVIGYEIFGRIHMGAPSISPRFRSISTFGPFAAAAAAGKLLKLNEDQLTHALGYAANFAGGFLQGWVDGTMEVRFHAGVAARDGVMAAMIARAGATAAEETLEGEYGFYQAFARTTDGLDAVTTDLGKSYLMMDTIYKAYPV